MFVFGEISFSLLCFQENNLFLFFKMSGGHLFTLLSKKMSFMDKTRILLDGSLRGRPRSSLERTPRVSRETIVIS